MNEGGQSSTGQLIDFMVDTHPYAAQLKKEAKEKGTNHYALLSEILEQLKSQNNAPSLTYLTKDYLIYPDFHGRVSKNPCRLLD